MKEALVSELNTRTMECQKIELMEKCFNGFADLGLNGTGIRDLAKYCGYNTSMIFTYFENLDDLIIQSTEYCMSKVEDDFMAKAPTDVEYFYGGSLMKYRTGRQKNTERNTA
jgi:AcrR family transcriptional regulator